jgi:hypothetical protein
MYIIQNIATGVNAACQAFEISEQKSSSIKLGCGHCFQFSITTLHTHQELHSFLASTFFILSLYQPTHLYSEAIMVKLTEVEDEHFSEKPATTKDDALLTNDDDDDYTDTGTSLGELYSASAPAQRSRKRSIAGEQHKSQWPGSPCTIKAARTFGRTVAAFNAPILNEPKN